MEEESNGDRGKDLWRKLRTLVAAISAFKIKAPRGNYGLDEDDGDLSSEEDFHIDDPECDGFKDLIARIDTQTDNSAETESVWKPQDCMEIERPEPLWLSSLSSYTYTPLEDPSSEIRLLWLHPGQPGDELYITLSTWAADRAPEYRAISYTWGPATPKECLLVLPEDSPVTALDRRQRIRVHRNAQYALRQIRLHYPGTFVWMDQLCIDQDNLQEKSVQVARMASIYKSSKQVLACIGPGDASSKIVNLVSRHPDTLIPDLPNEYYAQKRVYENDDSRFQLSTEKSAVFHFVKHWNRFASRRYFSRLWIVQELYAGGENLVVLCGPDILEWKSLDRLASRLSLWAYANGNDWPGDLAPSARLNDLAHLLQPTLHEYSMHADQTEYRENVLGALAKLECYDARDRVYGVLGLVNWDLAKIPRPTPDYTLSLVDLALRLTPSSGNVSLSSARWVSTVLRLDNPEPRAELQQRVTRSKDVLHKEDHEQSINWFVTVSGVCRVQEDTNGRLCADLEETLVRNHGSGILDHFERPAADLRMSLPFAPAKKVVRIHTGDAISILAWSDVRPGDFLVRTGEFDMVLRPCKRDTQFIVVGRALFLGGFDTKEVQNCDCWSNDPEEKIFYESKPVTLSLSGVNTLDVLLACAVDDGTIKGRADSLTVDFPPIGSIVEDSTAADWRPHQLIRKIEDSCTEHDAAECNRWRRNGLRFMLASNCGYWLPFDP